LPGQHPVLPDPGCGCEAMKPRICGSLSFYGAGQAVQRMDGNREAEGTVVKPTATVDTREVRRLVLRVSRRANVGHIGSCLCVVEILAALYGGILRSSPECEADRDRFILSKGHAALALYSTLAVKGWLPVSDLDS